MGTAERASGRDWGKTWESIRAKLRERGIDIETGCAGVGDAKVKVVCVPVDLAEAVEEVGQAARDVVVMVRLDQETTAALDAWVETGSVRSRSEAAAVFIREGLRLREEELRQLKDALGEVERAKAKLRERAKEVFGGRGQG